MAEEHHIHGKRDDGRNPRPQEADWRLLQMMAIRGIRSATELQRLLADVGVKFSRQQISKVMARVPSRISLDLLVGLARVLQCGAGDLIRVGEDLKGDPKGEVRQPSALSPSLGEDVRFLERLPTQPVITTTSSPQSRDIPGKWLEQLLSFPFRPYPLRTPVCPGKGREGKS